jgi:hypothetical protein
MIYCIGSRRVAVLNRKVSINFTHFCEKFEKSKFREDPRNIRHFFQTWLGLDAKKLNVNVDRAK